MSKLGARFNRWWIALWATNVVILTALLALGVSPLAWVGAFMVLFMLPEMVGLLHRGDALPPLTLALRRYVPRWIPTAVTFAAGAWMAVAWYPRAAHPLLMVITVAGSVGWLTNHWDVTYDGPGE